MRVVVLGVVGVNQVPGIRRDAGATGEQRLRRVEITPCDGGDPLQHVLEERPGRPGTGGGTDLLVVEGGQDHQVVAVAQVLDGRQSGVGAGEVVQTRRGEELVAQPETTRRL